MKKYDFEPKGLLSDNRLDNLINDYFSNKPFKVEDLPGLIAKIRTQPDVAQYNKIIKAIEILYVLAKVTHVINGKSMSDIREQIRTQLNRKGTPYIRKDYKYDWIIRLGKWVGKGITAKSSDHKFYNKKRKGPLFVHQPVPVVFVPPP